MAFFNLVPNTVNKVKTLIVFLKCIFDLLNGPTETYMLGLQIRMRFV